MLVEVQFGDQSATLDVEKNMPLGKAQKALCKIFRQPFPKMKAAVEINGDVFDEFIQEPFSECGEGDIVLARFDQTDDPFMYDLFDRRPNHDWLR